MMRERVRREMLAEQELLLAPEFFAALPQHFPDIAAVEVQLKRMQAVNELSGYRYEVVLRKAPVPVRSVAQLPAEPWQRFGSLAGLGEYLRSQHPPELRVTGVPHGGVWPDVAMAQALAQAGDRVPVSELRAGISAPGCGVAAPVSSAGAGTGICHGGDLVADRWLDGPHLHPRHRSPDGEPPPALSDLYLPTTAVGSLAGYVNDPSAIESVAQLRGLWLSGCRSSWCRRRSW